MSRVKEFIVPVVLGASLWVGLFWWLRWAIGLP